MDNEIELTCPHCGKPQKLALTVKTGVGGGITRSVMLGNPPHEEMHAPRLEPRKTREELDAEQG